MKTKTGLENEYGQNVSLKSVHLEGKLEGLLLTMLVKQRYLNDSEDTIEASYTFPAGWGANLMGFSVELNGKRMQAVALAKKKAEKKYEEAIDSGDTPVMLEKSPLGLYTANLGNLKPGEEAVIIIEYAQLLRFEKGRVRITVPTVIGERYGDEVSDGHIAPHQTVDTDLLAEYPFTATLDILGQMAAGEIACPSHKVDMEQIEGGTRVRLAKGGLLDRDFVVTVEDLKGESFVSASEDDGAYAVVASFCPKLKEKEPTPLGLKILVDCSGSMQGDSIEQAQEAMHELILRLAEQDMISYSKFGSKVIHTSNQLEKCTPRYIKNVLAKAVHETAADLGGTELNQALTSTFKISFTKAYTEGCDLLLITDGDVWEIEEIVKQAKISNHRIFAIGVGSAPAESLLKDLAEQTGGACELVTPSESISEAVLRMTQRIRSARTSSIAIHWEGEVLWQSKLPKQVFSDETIHVYARIKSKPTVTPTLRWTVENVLNEESAPSIDWNSTGALHRMVAGAEITSITDEKAAEDLALKYQLASKYTNLLLVHVREEEEKAEGLPKLQKIKQMSAAGWGGLGTVEQSRVLYSISASRILRTGTDSVAFSASAAPAVWRSSRSAAASRVSDLSFQDMDDFEVPAFLRKQDDSATSKPVFEEDSFTPEEMLEKFNELSLTTTKFSEITWELMERVSKGYVWKVLCEMASSEDEMDAYWACLLRWLSNEVAGIVSLTRHSQRLLNAQIANIEASLVQEVEEQLAQAFPTISKSSWGQTPATEKRSLLSRFKKLMTGG
jgi:Ca-activated chloride channel family protein